MSVDAAGGGSGPGGRTDPIGGSTAGGGSATDGRAADDRDLALLREAIALAAAARAAGRHPFGALLVAADGEVLARAGNASAGGDDPTAHAELVAVRRAAGAHGTARLRGATLYSSAEPCAMCAGAAYWAGLGRVVYGLSERSLRAITGDHPENPTLDLPCTEVFARGQRVVRVVGPLLADEAAAVHDGFWTRD